MQVASTLWPDIKSQKLLEHRFRLKWTKCSPRTEAQPLKTGSTPAFRQKETQDSPTQQLGAVGATGWPADHTGRLTAQWPHRLQPATWRHPIGSLWRFQEVEAVAPSYKYRRVENENTDTHTPQHTHLLHNLQAQWSLGEVQESSSRRSCSRVLNGFISSSLL